MNRYQSLMTLGISSAMFLTACTGSAQVRTDMSASPSPLVEQHQNGNDVSPSATPMTTPNSTPQGKQDVVMTMQGRADLSQAVSFLTSTKLTTTLKGPGPFTIFAPSNSAIAHVDKGIIVKLMKKENANDLASTMMMHVVPGVYYTSDLHDGQKIKTLQGNELTVSVKNNTFYVDDIALTTTDINASNGVVHVADGVIVQK